MKTFQEFADAPDFKEVEMRRFDGIAAEAKQKLEAITTRLEEIKSAGDWDASPKQFAQSCSELYAIINDLRYIAT